MKTTLIATLLGSSLLFGATAFAANVPEGTVLSDNQSFTFRLLDETSSLDPQVVEDVDGSAITRAMFEGLYNQDENGDLIPAVALSHEVSEDGLTYTFHLRDNAKWSNGDPVVAGDFVYGWQRAASPELASPYAWYMSLMSVENVDAVIDGSMPLDALGVSAPDDQTFVVKLSQPLSYFPQMVTQSTTFPAHRATVEKFGAEWTRPGNIVSNGAFVLKDHVPKERVNLVKNEQYWDAEHTVLTDVNFLVINDEVTGLTRYKAGEVDRTDIPAGQYPSLKEELPDEAYALPQLCNYYFNFNLSDNGPEAFKDERVRYALAYAIDRQVIVDQVLQGGQFPAYTFTPAATAGFEPTLPDYANWTQEERDAKAKELMAEAGYGEGGKPLAFKYLYNTSDSHQQIAIVASQMWKQKLGVDVELENQEWKVFLENRGAQNFDMARGAWCGDYNEASTFLDLVQTNSGYNDAKYSNPTVDELLAKAKTEADPSGNYTEIEAILANDMPVIPIYHYSLNMLLKSDIKGWPLNNVQQRWYVKDLYRVAE